MRIGLISDIHGNSSALETVLSRLDALGVRKVVCLGDTAGYYDQINVCCEILRERDILCLMGNHDHYLTTDAVCPRSKSATDCLRYQLGIIDESHLAWLRGLPRRAMLEASFEVVHGGWNDPLEEYMTPSEAYFAKIAGTHFASGHTHLPIVWTNGKKSYCNPGSVGQPRDGDPRASFAIYTSGSFEIHRVEYDIAATQYSMKAAGFDEYYFRNLSLGLPIGAISADEPKN